MEFKYIGDCSTGFVVLYGVKFEQGKAVKVEDPALIGKLSANSHFKQVVKRAKSE